MPCSLLHIDALGKPRRLGLLGASVNKNIFLVDLVAHFLKLYVGCMSKSLNCGETSIGLKYPGEPCDGR